MTCFFENVIDLLDLNDDTQYTPEQRQFVEDNEVTDGKLISPPGSGKTTCILGRRKFLLRNGYQPSQVLVVTFTRASARDLQTRMSDRSGARTIDSLAFRVLRTVDSSINASPQILTAWFKQFLVSTSANILRAVPELRDLSVLLVDEAQDLNQDQYDIVMMLKHLLDLTIYMVGDPNQSIYAFRDSSPAHLVTFPGKTYVLTVNFRSTPELVQFTEHLKPHQQFPCRAAASALVQSPKPLLLHNECEKFIDYLHDLIRTFDRDLSQLAILCPVRGNNQKSNQFLGLARMATCLESMNVPFVQLYDEASNSQGDERRIQYESVPGHVNLLTYHGSKGLEWDTVICADVWHELMLNVPTKEEQKEHKYLLYVATTRAKRRLILWIEATPAYNPSPLLEVFPLCTYDGFVYFRRSYKYRDPLASKSTKVFAITQVIQNIKNDDLLYIEQRLTYQSHMTQLWEEQSHLVTDEAILMGNFLENLFSLQCSLHRGDKPRTLPTIENLIHGQYVIVDVKDLEHLLLFQQLYQTWENFEAMRHTCPATVRRLVKKYMCNIPLERHLFTSVTYMSILNEHQPIIRETYRRYKEAHHVGWNNCLDDLFYLTIVKHAYDSNHLFHIKNRGERKRHLLTHDLTALFEHMNSYAAEFSRLHNYREQVPCTLEYPSMCGVVDWLFDNQLLVEFKASHSDLNIQRLLQLWCYQAALQLSFANSPVVFINFLTGRRYDIQFTVSDSNVDVVIDILSRATKKH